MDAWMELKTSTMTTDCGWQKKSLKREKSGEGGRGDPNSLEITFCEIARPPGGGAEWQALKGRPILSRPRPDGRSEAAVNRCVGSYLQIPLGIFRS